MSSLNVLVIFYSISGATEKLALAAAVGAVQARANIRMRRLTDSGEESPECARMRREYIPPAQADAEWADAVIVGIRWKDLWRRSRRKRRHNLWPQDRNRHARD